MTEWIVDHPKRVTVSLILITLIFAAFVPFIKFEVDFKKFLPKSDPAVQALNRAEARYGSQEIIMVIVEPPETVFAATTLEKIREMEERFKDIPGVDEVQGPTSAQVITGTEKAIIISEAAREIPWTAEEMAAYKERLFSSKRLRGVVVAEDGKAGAIIVRLKAHAPRIQIANRITKIAKEYEGPERIYIAGLPAMHATMIRSIFRDLYVLIPLVVAVVALLLYLSFRNRKVIPICMPVVGMSLVWTIGTMVIFNQRFTPFSVTLPVMLVAIGVANGIHILNRYYEEGTKGSSQREMILNTMDELRGPVVMTSLTTAAGFLSLASSLITAQRSLGVFTAVGVIFAMFLSLTYIPAMLTRLKPSGVAVRPEERVLGNGLAKLARVVYRGRVTVLVITVLVIIACAIGIPRIKVETIPSKFLGENNPVVQAMDVADRQFGGSAQLALEVDTSRRDDLKDPQVLKEMVKLQGYLESIECVHHAVSLADLVREMNQKFHADDPSYYVVPDDRRLVAQLLLLFTFQGGDLGQLARSDFSSGEVIAQVPFRSTAELEQLTSQVQEHLNGFPTAPKLEEVDMLRAFVSLFTKMPISQALSLAISAAAATLIVMLLMRSVIAGLICIIPLILTVLINFGFMAYSGMPLDMATLMVASTAIGIGIDYAIHFVSRFRIEAARNERLEEAFAATMRTEGKAISYNAIIVALGFAVLLGSSFRGLVNVGILISLTMVVSALSSFTVIPAMFTLWEPRFLRRGVGSREMVVFEGAKVREPVLKPDPKGNRTDKEVHDEES